MKSVYQTGKWLLVLLPMMILISGCTTTGTTVPKSVAVDLPPRPAFMQPVAEPVIAKGDDARIAFRKMRGAVRKANGNLTASAGFYDGVRNRYGGKSHSKKR